MTRLKWLWWKFWAWLTKPWAPKESVPNPRSRKPKHSAAYLFWVDFFKMLNMVTGAVLGMTLVLWFLVTALAP